MEEVADVERTMARTSEEEAKGSGSAQFSDNAVPANPDRPAQCTSESTAEDAGGESASVDDTSASTVAGPATTGVTP